MKRRADCSSSALRRRTSESRHRAAVIAGSAPAFGLPHGVRERDLRAIVAVRADAGAGARLADVRRLELGAR
jgi:hypothetical protein